MVGMSVPKNHQVREGCKKKNNDEERNFKHHEPFSLDQGLAEFDLTEFTLQNLVDRILFQLPLIHWLAATNLSLKVN